MTQNLFLAWPGPGETFKRKSLGPNICKCERDVKLTYLLSIQGTDMMKRAVKETQKASKEGKVSFYRANWTLEASSVIPIVFYWHEIVQATHLHICITLY